MLNTQINRLLLAVVLVNLCAIVGCHRSYYRRQADAEAQRLILEKSFDPRWNGASGDIAIDPQSRMFDPFSQDHPPIPPDDASSHQLMHCVDGKEGYPQWHANGDTNYVENPQWKAYLPINEQGQVVLNLERAFQLALINSPEYQRQRESLYLSALDVSLQRFGFDTQLFVGNDTTITAVPGFTDTTNSFNSTLRRLGTTGANFAVGLANTILFNFNSGGTQSASSLVDFSVIQPLLRGAGRDRIMESLTQSERDLLANIRQLERFRRGFYLDVAVGRNPGINVNSNLLNLPGVASSQAGGFLGLLQQQQRIRNQELNVRQLEASLEQFREFFERERFDAVQLKRFESSFYNQQRNLLTQKTSYQDQLDRFKFDLGLPPDLNVIIEDSFLDQFKLISDEVNDQLIAIQDLREDLGAALNDIDDLFENRGEPGFEWPTNVADKVEDLLPFILEAELALEKLVTEDREQLESDFKKLEESRPNRLAYLKKLSDSIAQGRVLSDVDPSIFEPKSIPEASQLRKQLENPETDEAEFIVNAEGEREIPGRSITKRAKILAEGFVTTQKSVEEFRQLEGGMTQDEVIDNIIFQLQEKIPGQLSELNTLMLELSLLQATARSNSIEINDVDIRSEQAIRIARCFRRDWMNARAALVDNWRNIEFVADQLESQVDLIFEGDMGLVGNTPFNINYNTGALRAGLRFDLPIVRLAERNNYRAALINYQQTRRQFYQFEDSVKQNIRQIIRNVDQNKVLFELDRRTVQVSIENIEVNRFELDKPVAPGASLRLGATTAQNLSDAIIQLNGNQNAFLSSWVQLEVLRRNLDYDMGTMQLNEIGEWIDPGAISTSVGLNAAAFMGLQLDCQFCENIGIPYEDAPSVQLEPAFDESPVNSNASGNLPEQPPLEPIPDTTPDANALDPQKPRPELNQPQAGKSSGSRSPAKVVSQVPPLLFQPVKTKSGSASKVAEKPTTDPSNKTSVNQSIHSKSTSASGSGISEIVALPRLPESGEQHRTVETAVVLERPAATSVNWEQAVMKRSERGSLGQELPPVEEVATGNLIERQFVERRPSLAAVQFMEQSSDVSAGSSEISPGLPLTPIPEVQADQVQNSINNPDIGLKPLPPSVAEAASSDAANSAFQWRSNPSSLGGILNRFQGGTNPDEPSK